MSKASSQSGTEASQAREELRELTASLTKATVDIAWRQWSALGGTASVRQRATALVDPEALVLVSLALDAAEPRLTDLVADWMTRNSDLLSVQRMRNLAKGYPEETQARLGHLARIAYEDAKDHRWKSLVRPDAGALPRRRNKRRTVRAQPIEPAALVLRLRLAFGVGIKADLLAYLLGTDQEAAASIAVSAVATGYTVAAVRKAANDLVAARLIEAIMDAPTHYQAPRAAWRALLQVQDFAKWRAWSARFAFVVDFLDWASKTRDRPLTRYVLESAGRDLIDRHATAFRWHQVWRLSQHDAASPGVFGEAVTALRNWMVREA
jgi:hypothetical protein